ncbi:MAG: hypothetical protein D3922_15465 [Candidatus Electrothrix sp. AR1]|nr:hypothetical protein [Candidatus Electrothrix sp. AR1]
MIDAYFRDVEHILQEFPNIRSSALNKKQYNAKQGYISGSVYFDSGCRLEFMELKDTDRSAKINNPPPKGVVVRPAWSRKLVKVQS